MSSVVISGIQQIGIGVTDVNKAWKWYRKYFGMDIRVFEDAAIANFMLPYTGGEPRERYAALALNLQGGGGFEIWQYTQRVPQPPKEEIRLGDLGIFCTKIRAKNAQNTYHYFKEEGLSIVGDLTLDPRGCLHFYVQDLGGNFFEVVENKGAWFKNEDKNTGGTFGAVIGCTDLKKSIAFYRDILGYDQLCYEGEGTYDDLKGVPLRGQYYKRAILTHSKARQGAFSGLFGESEIELFEVQSAIPIKIFEGRYWGDLGFIHLCFDISGMDALRTLCAEKGSPFTVDSSAAQSGASFDMGEAAGFFSYIEDPDGTLIEFVETHKVPILKKIGWNLNLKSRSASKPLSKWLLKAFALNRVRD
ncbi:MAG: VOC family protein [Flammeovirgaceae bacterium]|jgi:catechol 2,3-dioxygenase-like lactoylglutathione lyase family enzyme|nr:VOC family protein [Flammeovirgaceae bacterium]|tara:strand:+ start:7598 stop:8677 length:1080 start_codon:yes stop_codon:yes gene_type:complete